MRDKLTVVQTYKRYLDKINGCEPAEVPTNFGKMMDFIYKEIEENELWAALSEDCVYQTLKVIKRKDIRLKGLSEDWDTTAIEEVWRLQGKADEYWKEGDSNSYKITFCKLRTLIGEVEDNALKLYLYLINFGSNDGKDFYRSYHKIAKRLIAEIENEALKTPALADEAEAEAPNT